MSRGFCEATSAARFHLRESRASRTRNDRPERQPSMKCASSRPTILRRGHRAAVAAADREPVRGVQHRQRQRLLGRPVLALDLQVGQPQAGHGDDGQRGVGAEQVRSAASRRTAAPAASRRCPAAGWPVPCRRRRPCPRRQATTSSSVDVSSAGTWRTACRSSVAVDASRATCGGTSIDADVLHQHPALGPGVGDRDLELAVAGRRRSANSRAQRRRDQRVRRQRALLGAGQVEHPRVRPQLRHRAQPGQRAGRVEQGHLDAAPGGQVAERAHQRRLATAGLGDEHARGRSARAPPSGSAGRGRPAGGRCRRCARSGRRAGRRRWTRPAAARRPAA